MALCCLRIFSFLFSWSKDMPITLGDTTITGLGVGGLPAGTVNATTLASSAVTAAKMGYSGAILQQVRNAPTSAIGYSQAVSSYTEVTTAFRTAITPLSASSILILEFDFLFGGNNASNISTMKFYDITNNAEVGLSGFSSGSRGIGHASMRNNDADNNDRHPCRLTAYVSSGSTSARTYSMYHYSENAVTKYFNQTPTDNSGCSYCKWHFIITEVIA